MSFVKNAAAGAVLGGSVLFTAGLGVANAQPVETTPDGLVNIAVGYTTILQGVPTDAAAATAGALCASAPEDVNALAEQVDADGTDQTVCAGLPGGDLMLTQNVSAEMEQPEAGAADDAGQEAG
ncbi:MAG: hypothetical protein VYB90_19190 [Actinomycetota bacterium]|nr:hypothetical protein [Actinomycetota bacterium]